ELQARLASARDIVASLRMRTPVHRSVQHRDQLRGALQMKTASVGILPTSVRLVSCISLFDGASLPTSGVPFFIAKLTFLTAVGVRRFLLHLTVALRLILFRSAVADAFTRTGPSVCWPG